MEKPNLTANLTIDTDESTLARIVAAHQRDNAEVSRTGADLNEWLLGIVLDWVGEVEKGAPVRPTGFGN
jgi:hypothetical protein